MPEVKQGSCLYCGGDILKKWHTQLKYCSKSCTASAMSRAQYKRIKALKKPLPPKQCPVCLEQFVPEATNVKYCSRLCYRRTYKLKKKSFCKQCQHCRKSFTTFKSRQLTCSKDCSKKYNRSHCRAYYHKVVKPELVKNRVSKTCKTCGVSYTPHHMSAQNCSKECHRLWTQAYARNWYASHYSKPKQELSQDV